MATLINTITAFGAAPIAEVDSFTSATAGMPDQEEVFEADISTVDGRWYIEVSNTSNGYPVDIFMVPGGYVGENNKTIGSIRAGHVAVFCNDSSACRQKNGKIRIGIRPAAGQTLLSGGVKLHAVQFLPMEAK